MTKSNIGKHAGVGRNWRTFAQAYAHVVANPTAAYQTTGDQTIFTVLAYVVRKGKHKGQKTLRILQSAYVYECCWGCKTNCYGSHIDCYTAAI
jgi:hypothetical protein